MPNNNNMNLTQNGDVLWKQDIYGTDGFNRVLAGSIEFQADGDATTGKVPSKLVVKTATADGVLTSALTIDKTQSTSVARKTRKLIVPVMGNAKVGTTSGWVITAGTLISHATLPAGVTGAQLIIGVEGLHVGDVLQAVAAVGQIESGGNTVSCTMDVRTLTADAVAALTDGSLGTDQLGATIADTLLTDDNGTLKVSGLAYTVVAISQVYVVLTATTQASTDIDISHLVLTVDEN